MTRHMPPWPVWGLAVLYVLVEIGLIAGSDGAFGVPRLRQTVLNFGAFYPGVLTEGVRNFPGQCWSMFVTYGLLHAGIWHLVINTATLVTLAPAVIERVGAAKFFILYLGAQVGGGLGAMTLGATWVPVVGASGALFGLAGAIVCWEYADRFTARDRLWPVWRAMLILVILNAALWWVLNGRLAWETHLGGFIGGWIMATLIDPRPRAYDDEDAAD